MSDVKIVEADLANQEHAVAVLTLVEEFSTDPMGGGSELTGQARAALIPGLAAHPATVLFLAYNDGQAIGVAVCFIGFSTFAAKSLINIHDLFVRDHARGQGVASALIEAITQKTRAIGGCKVTLEVQSNNTRAQAVYRAAGFEQAAYEEAAGTVIFLTKPL